MLCNRNVLSVNMMLKKERFWSLEFQILRFRMINLYILSPPGTGWVHSLCLTFALTLQNMCCKFTERKLTDLAQDHRANRWKNRIWTNPKPILCLPYYTIPKSQKNCICRHLFHLILVLSVFTITCWKSWTQPHNTVAVRNNEVCVRKFPVLLSVCENHKWLQSLQVTVYIRKLRSHHWWAAGGAHTYHIQEPLYSEDRIDHII